MSGSLHMNFSTPNLVWSGRVTQKQRSLSCTYIANVVVAVSQRPSCLHQLRFRSSPKKNSVRRDRRAYDGCHCHPRLLFSRHPGAWNFLGDGRFCTAAVHRNCSVGLALRRFSACSGAVITALARLAESYRPIL